MNSKVYEIPIIMLAYIFTLLVSINSKQEDIDTSIQDTIYIPYNDNKVMVLEFIEDSIRKFVSPRLLNQNPKKYYRKNILNDRACVYLTSDSTIQTNFISYLEHYVNDNISFQENRCSWKKYVANFEKKYLNENYIISNIIIDSVEYLPIIAWGYFNHFIGIDAINFSVSGEKMEVTNNPLYVEDDFEQKFNYKFTNYEFSCTIDLTNYNTMTQIKKKRLSETDIMLQELDELIHSKGLDQYISETELSKIALKGDRNYANEKKRIQNVVSEYRCKKATDLTLATRDQDYYAIIKKEDYIR